MIINIWKKQDLELVKELPTEVLATIEDTIEILDENYGTERTAEDLGGYIAVVDKVGIEELKQHQLKGILPEHIDKIHGTDYISVLFLCSSDFSIVVICKKELKDIIEIKTSNGKAPIEKRKSSEFSQYFDKIWGLLNE